MSMTTTGYAALAAGEGWRYVGETDQPGWENGWGNVTNYPALAFRIRESGIVDIAGQITGGTGIIFYLPDDYRPANNSFFTCSGATSAAADAVGRMEIRSSDGGVRAVRDGANPFTTVNANGQFFLDPPVDA